MVLEARRKTAAVEALRNGSVSVVVDIMRVNLGDIELLTSGEAALSAIAEHGGDDAIQKILEDGGVDVIMAASRAHPESTELRDRACGTWRMLLEATVAEHTG